MKKIAAIVAFLLLVVATGGGVYFFRKAQDRAGDLAKTKTRLNEVKKAFEERGRLLDGLKKSNDNAESLSRQIQGELSKANDLLEGYQAAKIEIGDMMAAKKVLEDRVIEAKSILAASMEAAKSKEVLTENKLEVMEQEIADAKLLDQQLKQANKNIGKLNMDISEAQAELKTQRQLFMTKLKVVEGFERLGLSPDQIRDLQAENTRLKAVVSLKANASLPKTDLKEKSERTLRSLPLGLRFPMTDKRLTQPLKLDTSPKPAQP